MAALRRIVEDFGGTVPQVMGDGFMAVFGAPVAHEDDALRAVRAALAVRDHVRELNRTRPGFRLPEVHAGVNSGEVLVARSDEAAGFAVVGDTVNTASRLADLAPGGHVLVDERTRNRTTEAIRYGPRRLRRAKGKPEIVAYEALGVLAPPGSARSGRTAPASFVNRADALRRLEAELRAAERAARARVVVVTGEPGVGKSRLASEFQRRLRRGSVLSGRCMPFGQRLPLYALAEAVGSVAGVAPEIPGQQADAAIAKLARRVARGEQARTLERHVHLLLGTERLQAGQPSGSVHDAVRAARTVMEGLARRRPVTLVLDDLQWADGDLLRLLESVESSPWQGPVLILGLSRRDPRVETLPKLELHALSEGAMRDLAGQLLGPEVPQPVIRGPLSRAGGNPLFLEESIDMLVEAGALVADQGRWRVADPELLDRVPSTIRLLISARLDGLPEEEKRVLQDASVSGEAAWDRLVERISDVPNARAALRALEARDLLRRRPRSLIPRAVEYEFKHVLIRDVAYESLPRAHRAARHLDIAGWLRSESAAFPEEPVATLAYHYERAWLLARSRTGPPPDPETAGLAASYLGRWADRTLAYQARSAESLYHRALRVAAEAAEAVPPDLRAKLLIGRAEALIELGRHPDAATEAAAARDWAVRAEEPRLKARALLALGRLENDLGRVRAARPLLHDALAVFESSGDVRGQAWALHRISETWALEDYRRELEYLRQAHRLFVRSRDRWGRAVVVQDLAYLLTMVGGREFDRWNEESRRLTRDEGDLRSRAALLRTSGYYAHYRGEHGEAIRVMREARPIAVEAGDRYVEADTLLIESMATAIAGSPDEAERLAGEALKLGHALESHRIRGLGLLTAARSALRGGRAALAAKRLHSAVRLLEPPTRIERADVHLASAAMQLDAGAWDRVPGPARLLDAAATTNGWRLWEPLAPLLVGRAHLGASRLEGAAAELARAADLARSADAPGTQALARAARDQAVLLAGGSRRAASVAAGWDPDVLAVRSENRGLVALRAGPAAVAEALAAFREAVGQWERLGLTVWLARALAFEAEALRRAGRGSAAAAAKRRARNTLEKLKTPARNRPAILSPLHASGTPTSGPGGAGRPGRPA